MMPRKKNKPAVTAPVEDVDLPPDRHPVGRPLLGLLLLALLVLVVRAGWGWIAERRLNAVMADLQRRGLLARPTAPPLTDREREALFYLNRAAEAAALSPDELSAAENYDVNGNGFPEATIAAQRKVVAARSKVFADVSHARMLGPVRWPSGTSAAQREEAASKALQGLQRLLVLLQYKLNVVGRADGNDGAAVEVMRDVLFVARAAGQVSSPIAAGMAGGFRSYAVNPLDTMGQTMHVGRGSMAASPGQVKALINDLLWDEDFQTGLVAGQRMQLSKAAEWIDQRRAARPQRQKMVDFFWMTRRPDTESRWARWLRVGMGGPYYALQGARILQYRAAVVDALSATDYSSTCNRLPPTRRRAASDPPVAAIWVTRDFNLAGQDARGSLTYLYRGRAAARLAAVQVAVRWYACRHGGYLPPTLDALVPQYLPAIPTDPFATGGARIKYLPATTQPCVYSVGTNGFDDIGAGTWMPEVDLPLDGRRFTKPDIIWYVARPWAKTQPAGGS